MEPVKEVRLYVSIPSSRDWKRTFGVSLAGLVHYLTTPGIAAPGYKLTHFVYRAHGNASSLPASRQAFIDEMIALNYTHWLSLDDDMTFPMNIVDMLIAHGKDVVSCNARLKTHDINEIKTSVQGMDYQSIDSTGRTGLEELQTMGGAIFLAKIDTFKNIPKPHFQFLWSEKHQDYIGEDVHFSTLLRVNGVQLWCDHDASQQIGHVGEYEYRFPEVDRQKLKVVA